MENAKKELAKKFQPTLPARGATYVDLTSDAIIGFQPTLPARGATSAIESAIDAAKISTHAPRTGSDPLNAYGITETKAFQPTLPARGATMLP